MIKRRKTIMMVNEFGEEVEVEIEEEVCVTDSD
jgi:hypothetical protein